MRFFKDEWLVPTVVGFIGSDKLEELRRRGDGHQSLWETVVGRGFVPDDQLLHALAGRLGVKVADLAQSEKGARGLIPDEIAFRYKVLPLRATDSYLEVATANPFDIDCEKALAFIASRQVRMQLASPPAIDRKLKELYRPENVLEELIDGIHSTAEVTQIEEDALDDLTMSEREASERPVIRMVDLILSEAIGSRASDIHIEPERDGVAVRYRIDGVLRQVMSIPRAVGLPLISRIKIMSGLDIANRLRPQDGRARVAVNGVPVDLRVSTLPAASGEKVVVRILDSSATELALSALGLDPGERQSIENLLTYRDGVLLVTGPTGSGKTTTLYSAIKHVQSEGVNIVTVEDPVEYRVRGIVQVQVHQKAGLTFASALRSILRQDPDVVLVGEVRDAETAQIAVQASLTGHMVLTTLHTNDAAGAVTRLIDIGVEAYKIGSALRGVIAQRLIRRLCPSCKQPRSEPLPEHLVPWMPPDAKLYRSVGCADCAMTGYRGRFAIVEVLRVGPDLEHLIASGEPTDVIASAARAAGMRTLWDSGLSRVLSGESSLDELLRVVGAPSQTGVPCVARMSGEHQATPPVNGRVSPERPTTSESRKGNGDGNGSAHALGMDPSAAPSPIGYGAMGLRPFYGPAPAFPPFGYPMGWFGAPAVPGPREPAVDLRFELVDAGGEPASPGPTVLVIEDDDQLRSVVREILSADGWTVAEARDGVEALEGLDRHAPDLILLDLTLPRRDGFEVLADLRSHPSTATLPVVVLSARHDEESELRVFALDADDFVMKPFRGSTLSARLRTSVRRRRAAVPASGAGRDGE